MDLQSLHGLSGGARASNRSSGTELEGRRAGSTGGSRRNRTRHGIEVDCRDNQRHHAVHLVEEEAGYSNNDSIRSADMPWDEQQSDDEGGSHPNDHRKSDNFSTPPLVEEIVFGEEEEKRTAKLEAQRLKQSAALLDQGLRRTPGASQMQEYEHMRRTPGATKMHRSAVAVPNVNVNINMPTTNDRTGLGYGLSLPPQVTASEDDPPELTSSRWEGAPGIRKPAATVSNGSSSQVRGPFSISPWNSRGSTVSHEDRNFSGRLTKELEDLLREDEEPGQRVPLYERSIFRSGHNDDSSPNLSAAASTNAERGQEWTAPFDLSTKSSKSRNSFGGRKGKGHHNARRGGRAPEKQQSRGSDYAGAFAARMGGFLPFGKQKANRNTPQHGGGWDNMDDNTIVEGRPSFESDDGRGEGNGILNFCGAFAPYDGIFHRTFPSVKPMLANSFQPEASEAPMEPSYFNGAPTFGGAFHSPVPQHQPYNAFEGGFAPQPPFGVPPNNMYGAATSHLPMEQDKEHFNYGLSVENNVFDFQTQPMHQQPVPPQNFIPVHQPPHQNAFVVAAPPPHVWPHQQPVGMVFDGHAHAPVDHTNWHGGGGAQQEPPLQGWGMAPRFGYGVVPGNNDPSLHAAHPVHTGQVKMEFTNVQPNPFVPDMQVNPFTELQKQPPQTSNQPSNRVNNNRNNSQRGRKNQNMGNKKNNRNRKKNGKGKNNNTNNKKTPTPPLPISEQAPPEVPCTNDVPAPEVKRQVSGSSELMESKAAWKTFNEKFRSKKQSSMEDAEIFASTCLRDGTLPESIHWKVYLELADLAKRANRFADARSLYQQVCSLQPTESQVWLDYSKLEEDCYNMKTCAKILDAGLERCELNENLMIRAIKHQEKMSNLDRARELLAKLKQTNIQKVWKIVLEGALMEARAGNHDVARRVLKYLIVHVSWYGPLYLEAYKLEKDLGSMKDALGVVEKGLKEKPQYGPLWFGAFKLCEEMDVANERYDLPRAMEMISRATGNISKELVFKVHLEAASMLERVATEYLDDTTTPTSQETAERARNSFAEAMLNCPKNQKWKVWLAAGRMEVLQGNYDAARTLFRRAQVVVPEKGRAVALLECAMLEEYAGDVGLARAVLTKSRNVCGNDWKVWLESVFLEIRNDDQVRALELAELGLELHSGTGRLWASLVQLHHYDMGERAQFDTLKLALNAVPKSGEVWCEGARIHLNPFSRSFDPNAARRHLLFATNFTPQYGDCFLEMLKQEIIEQWLAPVATRIMESSMDQVALSPEGNGLQELGRFVRDICRDIFTICGVSAGDSSDDSLKYIDDETASFVRESLNATIDAVDTSQILLWCSNADPNYGSLWFQCRGGPNDTARRILARAADLIFDDVKSHSHLYLGAFARQMALVAAFKNQEKDQVTESGNKKCAERAAQLEERAIDVLLAAPSLEEMFSIGGKNGKQEETMDLLKSTMMTPSDFVTGLIALNKKRPMESLPLDERRKVLYGTDPLFS
ncbi:unnamed protein product [Cylindrotheca closterium]|uniref:Uncharacterized protein n=1 Tax=Cylindrotheca closterium TaxID=2856 RepID=A0AAD2FVQ7_9STRA|nr:unnamed protein product [Cylindrotheca closterium]